MAGARFSTLRRMPPAIWVLGLVSMLMDISSESIHSLLPMFLVSALGTSVETVGLIEGLAEGSAQVVKVFSGTLSDYLGQRKWLAVAGYALGALSKPLFALAPGAGVVLGARVLDRIGKGVRGAPRDALVADLAPAGLRGAAFGLRQALDTAGAFLGPLFAVALMLAWAGDYRRIFWVAAIPAALAVLLLAGGVREPDGAAPAARVNPLRRASIARLGRAYWWVVAIGCVFTLARFSQAFLVLRAMQSGVRPALIPLVMVAMNLVYMLSAYPFGKLADTTGHARLLLIGLALLAGADLLLAQDGQGWTVLAGVGLWGLHMGMTQGLLSMMVAQCAPAALRGTAFGLFNLACGLALLASSTAAGWLWSHVGPGATFHAGAAFCLLTALLLALRRRATATI